MSFFNLIIHYFIDSRIREINLGTFLILEINI